MKPVFIPLTASAIVLISMACVPSIVRAQESPANPSFYGCVDTGGTSGVLLGPQAHVQAALPCIAPLGFAKSQVAQPSQTVFVASFNDDGTLAGPSALSGNATYNAGDGEYTITFKQPFSATPVCDVELTGNYESGYQDQESNISANGLTVAIQDDANYDASPASFEITCALPQ